METEITLVEQYKNLFGTYPPKLKMVSYTNDTYQTIIKEAIERNKPLDGDEVLEAFKDYKWDVVR